MHAANGAPAAPRHPLLAAVTPRRRARCRRRRRLSRPDLTARRAPPQHPPPAAGPATVRARTRHADLDIDRAVTRGRSACAAAASRAANIHLSLESGRLLRAELLTLLNNELKFSHIINNVMSATRLYHSI